MAYKFKQHVPTSNLTWRSANLVPSSLKFFVLLLASIQVLFCVLCDASGPDMSWFKKMSFQGNQLQTKWRKCEKICKIKQVNHIWTIHFIHWSNVLFWAESVRSLCVCMFVNTCVYAHMCMSVCILICICMCVCIHVHVWACACVMYIIQWVYIWSGYSR